MPSHVWRKIRQRYLKNILVNPFVSLKTLDKFAFWEMAYSFTSILKMTSLGLRLFTYSSEPTQERLCLSLCLCCLFPVGLFGSLRGKRHCSERPIKHKHRTMNDGRKRICSKETVLSYIVGAILGQLNRTQWQGWWAALHRYIWGTVHYLSIFPSDFI